MIYIIYYDFKNTSGNHAGMAYLANRIANKHPDVKLIKHFTQERKYTNRIAKVYSYIIMLSLFIKLKKGDVVFFMEYLSGTIAYQDIIANGLRKMGVKNRFVAMLHLSPNNLLEYFDSDETILKKLSPINKVIVLGSSLFNYIKKIGFKNEVAKTLHFADLNYYRPCNTKQRQDFLNVLIVGSLKRDFETLTTILKEAGKNVVFHIVSRKKTVISTFSNVVSYDYLSEPQLLAVIQKCQVNLSVLEDTVGSNAITSTMSAGLIQVVSDVGSIRDYCSEEDSFLCSKTADYVNALSKLSCDEKLLEQLRTKTLNSAKRFDLNTFLSEFNALIIY